MFLATTADQRFWEKDEKILFLGEWCKVYHQKHTWSGLDYVTLPYHWDDRKRMLRDHNYINGVYEQYIEKLSGLLNEIHGKNFSNRYWRIIIGPWLGFFVQELYERYLSILSVLNSGLDVHTWLPPFKQFENLTKDTSTFMGRSNEDLFNLHLYGQVIRQLRAIPFKEINNPCDTNEMLASDSGSIRRRVANFFLRIYSGLITEGSGKVVFVASYIPMKSLIKLQLSLGQSPCLHHFGPRLIARSAPVDEVKRRRFKLREGGNDFENFLDSLLGDYIPQVYVEGYEEMFEESLKVFPKNPEIIVTAAAFVGDEGFKFWAAKQVEHEAKLLIAQHGGHYGIGLWSSLEDHEIKISDRYYTWGWRKENEPKTIPMSSPKLIKFKESLKSDPEGQILWAFNTMHRYYSRSYSAPVGSQWKYQLQFSETFANTLSQEVRDALLLRLYPADWGWDEKKRWEDLFPMLKIYQGSESMFSQLKKCRLFIGCDNLTSFLELLAANFPTILFWDTKYWEIRPSAQPYFDDLSRAGIFHSDAKSAANKVNEIYKDPLAWWTLAEVQEAKDRFAMQFARTSDSWLSEWTRELKGNNKA